MFRCLAHRAIVGVLCHVLPMMCAVQVSAQNAPKYSNEFLKIGVGARAAGMGNAMTASSHDATAGYWNPAALTALPYQHDLAIMHSEYFAGIAKYDYVAYTTKLDSGRSLAFSFIRLGVDDIPNTLNFRDGNTFNFARITAFSVADMALLVSYAQQIKAIPGLSLGGNFKLINRTIGQFATAWGFGLDVAAYYTRGQLRAGLVFADATSTFNIWSYNTETFSQAFLATGNEIPQNGVELTLPALRLGLAYLFFSSRRLTLLASTDVAIHFDGPRNVLFNTARASYDPRLGLELAYKKLAYLRAGLMNMQRLPQIDGSSKLSAYPTLGLGVNVPIPRYILQVDYALSNVADLQQGLYSHVISLRFAFDNLKKK